MPERPGELDVLARRYDVVAELADGPLHEADLVDRLAVSRSTVDRYGAPAATVDRYGAPVEEQSSA